MVSGQLRLRGADPFALESPTSISGTNTDGVLSGVTFATPTVTTEREAPEYNTTATITAAFSTLQPGTGAITEQGNVTVQVQLAVDLHIVVPLLPEPSDCRAAPINLTLTSTAPYDPDTQRVTLRAANFSVPPIVAGPGCNGLLVEPVNDALAGAGHSLTLTMAGALTPPPEGEPTATTLAASPTGSAAMGQDVTLTATVAPNPAVESAPAVSGVVTFTHDGTPVGTAEVAPDGTATLVTPDLPAGPIELRATYGGAPPDWDPSVSAALTYVVIAPPGLSTTATGEVRIGGPAKDFTVTMANTGFGSEIEDARLEVTIRRQSGGSPIGPNGPTDRVVLRRVVGGVLTEVDLAYTAFPQSLTGQIGDASTWLVPPGQEHTEELRLQVTSGTDMGPLVLDFDLVTGTGPDEEVLARTSGVITMVTPTRATSTLDSGNPGFPPFFPSTPPVTPQVRQGNVAELSSLRITSTVGNVFPTGTYTFTIDGVPVEVQHTNPAVPGAFVWGTQAPVSEGGGIYTVKVPSATPTGIRQLTVRYSGDALYAPAQRTWPFTVEERIGAVYECIGAGINLQSARFTANVEVQASLPSVAAAGGVLFVDRVSARMRLSRTSTQQAIMNGVVGAPEEQRDWRLGLAPSGTLVPATVTSANEVPPSGGDVLGPDRLIDLDDVTGTIAVDPTPGAETAYTLDTIDITVLTGGFSAGFRCTPSASHHTVGTVTSAGTALVVDPAEVVAEGAEVALAATVFPTAPGIVEFRDGTTTIGVVPVDATGTARMTTDDLPVGSRSLTARFFGGIGPSSPSAPVMVRVASCGASSGSENGAVVRLVYLELLGRCPDAAGFAHWKGRLDGGTSREAFARSIARTSEAVGRVVDDAYQAMLGRPADPAGRAFWTRRLQASGRYDRLLADLVASGEFWAKAGGTNNGAVTRIYEHLLGRSPDQGGLDYWVGRLDGGVSRRALVLALANLAEPLGVLVDDAYDEILDRKPTAPERTASIAHLRSTGDRSGLYAQLIGTQEFHDRAQGLPNPA